ncbi:MAG: ArsB/NhaD family transporter [Fusobacterium sp. JB021]|nr:ArsB/NhaD family transporter [Fusobacterium sp. JB021]MDP0507572.1 ArsB/NhaD family transporter [Fusobacterium sp. JB019]
MKENLILFVGIFIFLCTFYFIVSEKYPKSVMSVVGGSLMVWVGILDEKKALKTISYNLEILFLLIGMMIIVEIISETGLFQWVAIKIAQLVRGNAMKILIFLSLVTAFFSAMLDNVTTILLMVPITIFLVKKLKLDPKPFILIQIFMSNIGGTATMIGDPPNLIIASLGDINFNEFIINLMPIIIINIIIILGVASFFLRKKLIVSRELKNSIMELDVSRVIKNKRLMFQSLIVFSLVIIGFLTNFFTHMGLAIIAISGAFILILISKKNPEEILKKIEWDMIFFFGGLFILVQGVEELGIVEKLGEKLVFLTEGNLKLTSSLILIMSTFFSPLLGAIPSTLSLGKIILEILPNYNGETRILWWALSLGACLGGNMTIVGTAANMVGVSVAKKVGIEISFKEFFGYGVMIVLETTVMSLIYLYIRY